MKTCVMIVLRNEAQGFGVIGEITGRDGVVHSWDHDRGVIEATVAAGEWVAISKLDAVAYMRSVMCFAAAA